jgi:hypothetical protein
MAKSFFPFDAGAGSDSRESQWAKMARHWLNTGVIEDYLNELLVTADGSGMTVSVATGGAWIEGFYFESDAAEALTIQPAHATVARTDRVVVQLDRTANAIDFAVLKGVEDGSLTATALTQTDTLYEISLATVLVDAAVGVIAAGKEADTRTYAGNLSRSDAIAAYTPLAGIASKNADAAPSTYPSGVSHMGVGGAQTGWPASIGGTVITVRNSGIRVYQEFVEANGNNPPIAVRRWFRQGYSDGAGIDAWGPFQSVMTKADRLTAVAVNGTQADFGAATTRTLSTVLAIPGDWAEYRLSWLFTTQLQNLGTTGRSVTAHSAYNGTTTLFGTQGHIETVRAADSVITSVTGYLDVAAGVTGNRTFEMTLTASALDASLKSDNLTLHVTATRS